MNQKLKENIKEYVLALPKEIQEVIDSFEWADIATEIGRKNGLTEIELNDLQTETGLVLVNLTNIEDFDKNIERNVRTTKEEAKKISIEIFDKVFQPISEKITEKIKTAIKDKKTRWDQNVNFILSGGNYFFFLDKTN